MAFTAADVMRSASDTLQDEDMVRWPALDLRNYINDALREISARKPNACSLTTTLSLVEGARQTLPNGFTMLSRVICNRITQSQQAITTIESIDLMDATISNWQDEAVLPFHTVVRHVIHEMADPRTFYVVPGNNGSGQIEAVVGKIPAEIPIPASNPDLLASYASLSVDIHDIYQSAVTAFVLHRAFSKDSGTAGSAARATAFFELFIGTLQGFAAAEVGGSAAARADQAKG
jgi:hypothetical protein